eukprot:TRINITY_DN3163_c0_g2_i10.p3 TRINITY_DN3163_c0_g2~~TRINITY_DN3163_c0_g2_i10.p3  ORF type:complete len:224 (+),score=90.30 TRINITY_DN3163_c0_g2_i10:111-782(+)
MSAAKQPAEKKTLKGGAAVHEDSGLVDCGTIYSPKKGEVYSVTMVKAGVATGQSFFYILQLIKHDGKEMYSVFRKWGKIGTGIGMKKLEEYPMLSAARRTFETHFQEKTGNTWAEYLAGNFAKKPGRFIVLDMDYEANDPAGAAAAAAQATYRVPSPELAPPAAAAAPQPLPAPAQPEADAESAAQVKAKLQRLEALRAEVRHKREQRDRLRKQLERRSGGRL